MAKGEQTQFQKRTGLADETGWREAPTYDPFKMAIISQRPADYISISVTVTVGDKEREFTFGRDDIIGPNDSFKPATGWDATFRWAQQSERVKIGFGRHVAQLLAGLGTGNKEIVCQHVKGQPFPVVVEGRHSVLAARVANLIRQKLGQPIAMSGFKKRDLTPGMAAVVADTGNRSYERLPDDVLEQRMYTISENGWSDAQAAAFFMVPKTTIRTWRARYLGKTKAPPKAQKPTPLRRRQLRAVRDRLDELNLPGINNTLIREVVHVIATGAFPEGASDKVRHIFDGVLI